VASRPPAAATTDDGEAGPLTGDLCICVNRDRRDTLTPCGSVTATTRSDGRVRLLPLSPNKCNLAFKLSYIESNFD
jgi:hypothetical protein